MPGRGWNSTTPPPTCGASSTATPCENRFKESNEIPAFDERAAAMSKDLKRRGFRFVGPTICYALMQSCGLVNDHILECFRHDECAALA